MSSSKRVGAAISWFRSKYSTIAGLLLLALVLCWRLGSLPKGLSPSENLSVSSSHLAAILSNPLNGPYHLLQDLLLHLNHSTFFARFGSVVVALVFSVSFYYLLKAWFGKPLAALSTVLLVFTPYFLLASRSATPAIMYFMPIVVLAAYSAARRKPGARLPVLLLIISFSLSLYVPGMIWLIVLMSIYRFSQLRDLAFQADLNRRYYIFLSAITLLLLLPLFISLATHPNVIKQWLLLPTVFPNLRELLSSWLWAVSSLFLQSRKHQELSLARLPILDTAQVGLLVFGGYVMWSRLRRELLIIVGLCLLITLLSGLNGDYQVLALAVPLLMITIGMGLRYLFIEWRHVFPLNPIAKFFALGLMSLLVLTHLLFGIRYSLVAWPAVVATESHHVLK